MRDLTERIDALTEKAFWDGEEVDDISDAILSSWLEVKSTRYSPDEIAAALHACAEAVSKSTYH